LPVEIMREHFDMGQAKRQGIPEIVKQGRVGNLFQDNKIRGLTVEEQIKNGEEASPIGLKGADLFAQFPGFLVIAEKQAQEVGYEQNLALPQPGQFAGLGNYLEIRIWFCHVRRRSNVTWNGTIEPAYHNRIGSNEAKGGRFFIHNSNLCKIPSKGARNEDAVRDNYVGEGWIGES